MADCGWRAFLGLPGKFECFQLGKHLDAPRKRGG
jgi:hypothetical protein